MGGQRVRLAMVGAWIGDGLDALDVGAGVAGRHLWRQCGPRALAGGVTRGGIGSEC